MAPIRGGSGLEVVESRRGYVGLTTENALLPIIVADLANKAALDFLHGIAQSNGSVLVPLLTPPADRGEHILEVHIPETTETTLFFALPLGPPQKEGYPLTLRPYGERERASLPQAPHADVHPADAETPSVVARSWADPKLSEKHSSDLAGSTKPKSTSSAHIEGRTLAGGKLEIEMKLGAGAVGAVYRAKHRDLHKEVAVKVLRNGMEADLEFCQRFHAEALAASKLDHPNLIRVIDFGQEPDGLLYLSMEYLDGMSLQDLLDRDRKLSVPRAIELLMQVCAGLWHAHARGIVHRDIKPANIMLVAGHDDDGHPVEVVKVCDFGIALQPTSSEDEQGVAGTPEYMSPEACQGMPLDGRADVYACGVMLYELVTGKLPFTGTTSVEFARQHILSAPPPPRGYLPEIDPRLEVTILKAMAKAPGDRFANAREFRNALKELLTPARAPVPETPKPTGVNPMQAPSPPAAPPAPEPAPKPAGGGRADWLEDTKTSYDNFFTSVAATVEAGAYHEADALANELASSPVERLNEIAMMRARPEFGAEMERLDVAVRALAKRGEAAALGHVVRVMAAIYGEEAKRSGAAAVAPSTAGGRALALLHTLADPVVLQPFAEKILSDRSEPTDSAFAVLTWAQVAGAHALYAARLKQSGPAARARFVQAMQKLGPQAAPVVRGALDQLLPTEHAALTDPALADDLLRSVPQVADEPLGAVILRYARIADPPKIARDAVMALVPVLGLRAMPVMLATLQANDELTRIAALRGLRALNGVDEFVVRKVEPILEGSISASDELRIAAADALVATGPAARATATRLIVNALAKGDAMMSLVRGGRAGIPAIVAYARATLTLAPSDGRSFVQAKAEKSVEPLRSQLLALLK
jgi:serine/threonine-protein kinase